MRIVGMEVSDLVIVVVDVLKGLEKETINCLKLLQEQQIPFVIALNKIDRINGFKDLGPVPLQKCFKGQEKFYMEQLKSLTDKIICGLAMVGDGINASLYYENKNIKEYVSMIPVSARMGTGVADLVMLVVSLAEKLSSLKQKLTITLDNNFGYLIEMLKEPKLGTGYMAILRDGQISIGDTLLCLGEDGLIQPTVTGLFVPSEGSELKDKINMTPFIGGSISEAGIVFIKTNTEQTLLNGTPFYVLGTAKSKHLQLNSFNQLQIEHLTTYKDKITKKIELRNSQHGIYLATPTLGMLYACINYADIGVSGYTIGHITKTDVIKASLISKNLSEDKEIYNKRYTVILNYNTPDTISMEVKQLAESNHVKIISNNLIHKLFEEYDKYILELNTEIQKKHPTIIEKFKLQILQQFIIRKNDPILIGVKVLKGVVKKDSFVCAINPLDSKCVLLGQITNIQKNKKDLDEAKINEEICLRIESKLKYGEDFQYNHSLETYYSENDLLTIKTFPDVFKHIVIV
jgi:translation initiation factor 5B